ncbi:hypothetical protein CLOP_g11189 [Closterium sp. NIES-67]|nr:hypothetical protein CLOP_g11189 [Closterium sp. NIES-67]
MLPPAPSSTAGIAQTTGGGLPPSIPTPIAAVTEGSVSSAVRSYARGFTNVEQIEQIERLSGGLSGLTASNPRHQRRLSSSAVLSGQPLRAPKANIAEQFTSIKPRSNMRGRSHSMADLTSATIPDNVRVSPAYSPLSQFGIPSVARYVEGSGNHAERSFYASPTAGIATAARSSSQTDPAMSISQSGRKPPSPKLAEQFKSFGCGHGGSRRATSMV